MDDLNRAIKNEYDYYLDMSDGSSNHSEIQQTLINNGYLLTGQYGYQMCYEKPNKYDTFNVKRRHRQYMNNINTNR